MQNQQKPNSYTESTKKLLQKIWYSIKYGKTQKIWYSIKTLSTKSSTKGSHQLILNVYNKATSVD